MSAVSSPEYWLQLIRQDLPDFRDEQLVSPADPNYNCLAWALNCNSKMFDEGKGCFWPWTHLDANTVEGWCGVLSIHGFSDCDNAKFEVGIEKVAIYEDANGVSHAARMDQTGKWKSKLGAFGPDIDHDDLPCLLPLYGNVVRIMQRRRPDWEA